MTKKDNQDGLFRKAVTGVSSITLFVLLLLCVLFLFPVLTICFLAGVGGLFFWKSLLSSQQAPERDSYGNATN
jgi:hypothetical protein